MRSTRHGWLHAGIVGAPHGLDGSFHVAQASADLLAGAASVLVGEGERTIERHAGHDRDVILRLEGCADRGAAQSLRGEELLVARGDAPPLGPDEWWPEDLEGCTVHDGAAQGGRPGLVLGEVRRMLCLPSCEVLEVARRDGGPDLLVPLVSDAVRGVDLQRREIEINLAFLGG